MGSISVIIYLQIINSSHCDSSIHTIDFYSHVKKKKKKEERTSILELFHTTSLPPKQHLSYKCVIAKYNDFCQF